MSYNGFIWKIGIKNSSYFIGLLCRLNKKMWINHLAQSQINSKHWINFSYRLLSTLAVWITSTANCPHSALLLFGCWGCCTHTDSSPPVLLPPLIKWRIEFTFYFTRVLNAKLEFFRFVFGRSIIFYFCDSDNCFVFQP